MFEVPFIRDLKSTLTQLAQSSFKYFVYIASLRDFIVFYLIVHFY